MVVLLFEPLFHFSPLLTAGISFHRSRESDSIHCRFAEGTYPKILHTSCIALLKLAFCLTVCVFVSVVAFQSFCLRVSTDEHGAGEGSVSFQGEGQGQLHDASVRSQCALVRGLQQERQALERLQLPAQAEEMLLLHQGAPLAPGPPPGQSQRLRPQAQHGLVQNHPA